MKTFVNKDGEQYVTTKAVIESFTDNSELSYRFTATADLNGDTDIAGYFAKSLGREYTQGDMVNVSCKASILLGTDPSLENPGVPCNYLWSISRGGADDLSDDQISAIKALLG